MAMRFSLQWQDTMVRCMHIYAIIALLSFPLLTLPSPAISWGKTPFLPQESNKSGEGVTEKEVKEEREIQPTPKERQNN
eukprot:scaffold11934_cov80-Skeletonema_menzelii.AAC.4